MCLINAWPNVKKQKKNNSKWSPTWQSPTLTVFATKPRPGNENIKG